MSKGWTIFISILATIIISTTIFFAATPTGRAIWNDWMFALNKVDEHTYENQREVENTCRAMIATYNIDKNIYLQYKDSTDSEQASWANNAKIRANSTASIYNNYIIQNSFVWQDNVPSDIFMTLAYIE